MKILRSERPTFSPKKDVMKKTSLFDKNGNPPTDAGAVVPTKTVNAFVARNSEKLPRKVKHNGLYYVLDSDPSRGNTVRRQPVVKVGLNVEVVEETKSLPPRRRLRKLDQTLPPVNPESDSWISHRVERDVYVRISQDDFSLLASLPDASYGLLREFLSRARRKKLTSGRIEVLASEDEIREVISALREFLETEEESPSVMTHAQDMLSSWERNYIQPERRVPKSFPSYENLPRGTNVRTFYYRGAKYVLVEAAEAEEGTTPEEKFLDMISGEEFAEFFYNITEAVGTATPLKQLRTLIDRLEDGRKALDRSFMVLNDKSKSLRMVTDALYDTDQNRKNLARLVTEEGLLESLTKEFLDGLAKYGAAASTADMAYRDTLNYMTERGFTSQKAAKRGKSSKIKYILRKYFNIYDPASFVKKFFHIPERSPSRKRKEPVEPIKVKPDDEK
jgi:hypothetical protein